MFSTLVTAGIILSLLWLALRAPAGQQTQAVDQGAGVLVGCLVGGRVGTVLANWAYYQSHLGETVQFWLGGISGVGAVLGGVLALPLLAWLTRTKLSVLADRVLPLLAVLSAAGWLGCWLEGCAYGLAANGAWWGLPARDEWGRVALRFPVQLTGALLGLAIPWLVEASLSRRPPRGAPPGWSGAFSLLGMGMVLFGLSFLRGDPTLLWNGLRPEAWGALGIIGISALMLIYINKDEKEEK